ncbi:MAG TPA: DinB family protein [Cyclobacteriaceae bacterium]
MKTNVMQETTLSPVITPEAFLNHWQGHRRVTRRIIEAFPEDKLFNFAVGGMRPFAELATEIIRMSSPGIDGILTGKWDRFDYSPAAQTKKEILQQWDEVTEKINTLWPQIPAQRFLENDVAFGQYEGPIYGTLLYFVDNEIHHRGQGYVYLRALGIEPPPFWNRM